MPIRAKAFYERLTKVNYLKGHVYHTSTKARVMQAKFFLECLIEEIRPETREYLDEFDKRDMFLFGLVNSLRSSLDSFTHEVVLFYGGTYKKSRDIDFLNLFNSRITIRTPPPLCRHISKFQESDAFEYLHKLRNAQQHRRYPLIQTQTAIPMSLNVVGPDSEAHSADWWGGELIQQEPVESMPPISSRIEPDLRLPDDPDVEPGDETYSPGRPLFGTMRHLYNETREFILSSYELVI